MKKTITFSIIVNILSTLGALLYFVAAAALFILIFVITGTIGGLGSTQNYAFGFGLILLIIVVPIALILIIFPILRHLYQLVQVLLHTKHHQQLE